MDFFAPGIAAVTYFSFDRAVIDRFQPGMPPKTHAKLKSNLKEKERGPMYWFQVHI